MGDKAKTFLSWVEAAIQQNVGLERAQFISGKGFLVHMAMTYDFMQPYLKGFHLSAEAWCSNRDTAGWKNRSTKTEDTGDSDEEGYARVEHADLPEELLPLLLPTDSEPIPPPPIVTPVPSLCSDVQALQLLLAPTTPCQVLVRPVEGAVYVAYGAGDASGEGFGSRIKPLGLQPLLRRGFWCTES